MIRTQLVQVLALQTDQLPFCEALTHHAAQGWIVLCEMSTRPQLAAPTLSRMSFTRFTSQSRRIGLTR